MTRPTELLIVGAGFMLAGQEPAGQYLSADDARQTAERILAHDQGGWPT